MNRIILNTTSMGNLPKLFSLWQRRKDMFWHVPEKRHPKLRPFNPIAVRFENQEPEICVLGMRKNFHFV